MAKARRFPIQAGIQRMKLALKLSKAGIPYSDTQNTLSSTEQAAKAAQPRRRRALGSRVRAMRALIARYPDVSGGSVVELLEGQPIECDTEDVRMWAEDGVVLIEDLITGELDKIPHRDLGRYLRRARYT